MKKVQALVFVVVLIIASSASAAMMGGGGMMGGTTPMMTNGGGFGMMNGLAGAPVVGEDGTAYLMTVNPTANLTTTPGSQGFETRILAVSPDGQTAGLTLNGIASKPVIAGNVLVATASLPDFSNYMIAENYGTNSATGQSILYAVSLPFSASTKPVAVSFDGAYASAPVIANNRIYVTTTDFGNAMMGNGAFGSMYGSYNFNNGASKTYLYIFNLDGSQVSKIEIQ